MGRWNGWLAGLLAFALCGSAEAQRTNYSEGASAAMDGGDAQLWLSGSLRFTPDLRDVVQADPGARLMVMWIGRDGATSRVAVQGGPGGRVERTYAVSGTPAPYDSAAARWLHRMLPELLPRAETGVRLRMERIHREQGLDSALAVAGRPGQPLFPREFVGLLRDSTLTPAEFTRVLQAGAQQFAGTAGFTFLLLTAQASPVARGSDTLEAQVIRASGMVAGEARVELLRSLAHGVDGPRARAAFLEAVRRLEFDDQRVRVLYEMLEAGHRRPAVAADAIGAAAALESAADRARVLLAVNPYELRLPPVRAAYEQALSELPDGPEKAAAAAQLARPEAAASAPRPTRP